MGNTVYIVGVDESVINRDGLNPQDPIGSAGLNRIQTFDRAWAFDEQLAIVVQYISGDLLGVVGGGTDPSVVGSAATTLAKMQPPLDVLVLLSQNQFADFQPSRFVSSRACRMRSARRRRRDMSLDPAV